MKGDNCLPGIYSEYPYISWWEPIVQVFCIFVMLTGTCVFGTLLSEMQEVPPYARPLPHPTPFTLFCPVLKLSEIS